MPSHSSSAARTTAPRGGDSGQYQTLSIFLYDQGFQSFKFGYASTIAWVLFLIILVFALVNLVITRRISSSD